MAINDAKRCFLEARTPYTGSRSAEGQEKYNLFNGLMNLADAMEQIQQQLTAIQIQLSQVR